jgi:hypothetical protein
MQDRPTAIEAVEAVAEFLTNELLPVVGAPHSFHVRVAANLLRIVERELREGPALERQERNRLVALLGHDGDLAVLNRELADALRAGTIDHRSEMLVSHLRQTAEERVRIANPRYLEPDVAL